MQTLLTDIYENTSIKIQRFTPYHPIKDRDFWESVPDHVQKKILKDANAELSEPIPAIPATLYMEFTRTGNRVNYENVYFLRRNRLNLLVLAECIENRGKYLDDIINLVWAICEESAWQLPPHNAFMRYGGILPLPDTSQPVLDLFACETGAQLACVFYLLQTSFDKVSPFVSKRIATEVHARIITPYLNSHFWWMGSKKEPSSNWTIWCTQNVLLSYFLLETYWHQKIHEKSVSQILEKACLSIDYFLASYGNDGCCDEGTQYYRHAALCLMNALEVLNDVTDNAFSSIYEKEKIKNMASYIFHMHIDDIYYVNFADCSPVAGRCGVREYLFGLRTNQEELATFAASDFQKNENPLLYDEINLYYRMQMLHYYNDIMNHDTTSPETHKDIYYESVGVFTTRDDTYFLAVKAGHNNDSHNHNDTGSFTIYKQGKPMFIDVGVETYSKQTFSEDRYKLWAMQSAYHNLPTLNGYMEHELDYAAKDVSHHFSDEEKQISMDLSGTFVKEAGIKSYIRDVKFLPGNEIVIVDTYEPEDTQKISQQVKHYNAISDLVQSQMELDGFDDYGDIIPDFMKSKNGTLLETSGIINDGSYILSYMTYDKPYLDTENANCIHIGDLGTMTLHGKFAIAIEELPITDNRLKNAWKHNIYRILVFSYKKTITVHIK